MSLSPARTVDVRGPRFAAWVTSAVLAVVLLTASGRVATAQAVVVAAVGAAGYLLGAPVLGALATGLALVAALLVAVAGSCPGCGLHLTVRRARPARTA